MQANSHVARRSAPRNGVRLFVAALATVALTLLAQAASAQAESKPAAASGSEHVRLRGGFSVGGGLVLGSIVDVGGNASLSGRLGLQFTRWLGLYYQNSPTALFFTPRASTSGIVGVLDSNSLLAAFDFGDSFEIGVGPTLDYVVLAGCDRATVRCDATSGLAGGVHARAAILIGSRDPNGGRRVAFAIGLDAHPIFFPNGPPIFLLGLNLGMEVF